MRALLALLLLAVVTVESLPTTGGTRHLDVETKMDVAADLAKLKAMRHKNTKPVTFKHVEAVAGPINQKAVDANIKAHPSKEQIGADLAALKAMHNRVKAAHAEENALGESAENQPAGVQMMEKKPQVSIKEVVADEKKVQSRFAKVPLKKLNAAFKQTDYDAAMANYEKSLAKDKKIIATGKAAKAKLDSDTHGQGYGR